MFAPLAFLEAGTLTSVTDSMTDQTISAAANHDIRFINSNGIDAPVQSIIIGFTEAFSLTTITPSDVLFSHGPTTGAETVEVLSSSSGIGIWGLDITGTVIRLSPPTNAVVGELLAGEKVILKIGTNAGGTHQITNPSTAGSYAILIYGDFGGIGSIRVPIVASSANGFGVSFTVPAAGSVVAVDPGCGAACTPPPPPPPPAAELSINAVNIADLAETRAGITWNTNSVAASSLYLIDSHGTETLISSDGPSLSHSAVISGLTPATFYRFNLRATRAGGGTALYGPGGFTTSPRPAIPNVSNFQAMRRSDGSIQLSWSVPSTINAADGYVMVVVARTDRYPTSASDGRSVLSGFGSSATDVSTQGAVYYTAFIQQAARSSSGAVTLLPAVTSAPLPAPISPTPEPVRPIGGTRPLPIPQPTTQGTGAATPVPAPTSTTAPIVGVPIIDSGASLPSILPQPTVIIPTAPPSTVPSVLLPVIVPSRPVVFQADTEWKTENGALSLAKGDQVPRILIGDAIQLIVSGLQVISSGRVEVDGSYYALGQAGDRQYLAAFVPGDSIGAVDVKIALRLASGEERILTRRVEIVSPALILERDKQDEPAVGARIEVQIQRDGKWEAVSDSERTLSADGLYRQYLAAGKYRLLVTKQGWKMMTTEFKQSATGPYEMKTVLEPERGAIQDIANVAIAAIEAMRTPEVQTIAQISAPVAAVAAVGATVAAASAFNILNYLRFLLTQPLLLFRRRRREKWGMVYNSLTKRPIDLAIVRLLDAKTGALRQTRITDAQGRFAFLAPAGSYRLQVVKPGLVFPSQLLANEKMDIDLVDLYHGEQVDAQVTANITPNIPLDPIERVEMPKDIIRRKQWRLFQRVVSASSLVVATGAVIIQPTPTMFIFTGVQIVVFLLFYRLAIPPKPKNWGIAYDGHTRKPLKQAVVRIFDKKYNKLLETQLTDREGKYAFLAGKNVYYVTADHAGYDRFVSKDVDLRAESLGIVREPLALLTSNASTAVSSSVPT